MSLSSKYLKLIGLFLLASLCLRSQTYYKIPIDTNYYWRQFSICMISSSQVDRYDYQIRYFKDTTINGIIYNKYSTFGRAWGIPCQSFIRHGYLRQDTLNKKVMMLDNNFVERPLYNFSKSIGDTLLSYNNVLNSNVTLTVQSINTATLFNGSHRKAMWVSGNNCFIEGIGSIFGGLYGHGQLMNTTVSEQLICFGTIQPFFELLEGITTVNYVCAFVPDNVGINENNKTQSDFFEIYPNPGRNEITIRSLSALNEWDISIHNALGQIVLDSGTTAGKDRFHLNIEDFKSGIYFVCFYSEGVLISTLKMVRE
jgi:hypothetical protein